MCFIFFLVLRKIFQIQKVFRGWKKVEKHCSIYSSVIEIQCDGMKANVASAFRFDVITM